MLDEFDQLRALDVLIAFVEDCANQLGRLDSSIKTEMQERHLAPNFNRVESKQIVSLDLALLSIVPQGLREAVSQIKSRKELRQGIPNRRLSLSRLVLALTWRQDFHSIDDSRQAFPFLAGHSRVFSWYPIKISRFLGALPKSCCKTFSGCS